MMTCFRNAMMVGKRKPTAVALISSGGQYINLNWVPAYRDTVNTSEIPRKYRLQRTPSPPPTRS